MRELALSDLQERPRGRLLLGPSRSGGFRIGSFGDHFHAGDLKMVGFFRSLLLLALLCSCWLQFLLQVCRFRRKFWLQTRRLNLRQCFILEDLGRQDNVRLRGAPPLVCLGFFRGFRG